MPNTGKAEITYNGVTLPQIKDTIAASVAQIFEADIKPMAQELSPVDRGTNRRSITTEVHRNPDGSVQAEIFTQSGYGGFLELGHNVHFGGSGGGNGGGDKGFDFSSADYVQGRPYIYPSFMKYLPDLIALVRDGIGRLRRG